MHADAPACCRVRRRERQRAEVPARRVGVPRRALADLRSISFISTGSCALDALFGQSLMRKKGAKAATAQPARTQDGCRFGLSRASPLLVGCRLCFERDPARAWPRACAGWPRCGPWRWRPSLISAITVAFSCPSARARARRSSSWASRKDAAITPCSLRPLLEQRLELRRERHRRRGPLAILGSVGVVRCGSVPTSVRSVPTAGADR